MSDRTFFYGLRLAGQGTPFVEGLRSYIQRLAFEHNIRPRVLLELLTQKYPLSGLKLDAIMMFKRWDIHGHNGLGTQLIPRLELATGCNLQCASIARLPNLFAVTHLFRYESYYCPECAKADGAIPPSPLLWEFDCVKACPQHGVRLRSSKVCGAPDEQKLVAQMRPMHSNVCSACGSIGFRCVPTEPEHGSPREVWVAKQVGALLALDADRVASLSPELLQAGLRRVVDERYGGSVVRASAEVGLSRSSACTWVSGRIRPSFGLLLELCQNAEAELVGVLEGNYVHAEGVLASDGESRLFKRNYRRTVKNWEDIRDDLIAAEKETPPPTLAALAKRLCINEHSLRDKLPVEAAALVAANSKFRSEQDMSRFSRSLAAYQAAAEVLATRGTPVSAKHLQREANLAAFTQNGSRMRALNQVIASFRAESSDSTAPPEPG